jgi:hypothetical protein
MKQRPSLEASSRSANQQILRLLQNPNIYFRLHKMSPLVAILSQADQVHIFT